MRRGHDEALVREYLERLAAHGVTDYSFDEAWRHYRFAVAYLMVLPVITLNGWDAMPERSRALCLTLTDRAVADHRRDRRTGGVRVTRSAREVVELYNLVVWNERDFALAEELMGDTVIRHEVGEAHDADPRAGGATHRRPLGRCSRRSAST